MAVRCLGPDPVHGALPLLLLELLVRPWALHMEKQQQAAFGWALQRSMMWNGSPVHGLSVCSCSGRRSKVTAATSQRSSLPVHADVAAQAPALIWC